jgi:hypothetical protein
MSRALTLIVWARNRDWISEVCLIHAFLHFVFVLFVGWPVQLCILTHVRLIDSCCIFMLYISQ